MTDDAPTAVCEHCEREFTYQPKDRPEPDLCNSCNEDRAFASIEAPEGGWPRGSDMDRI